MLAADRLTVIANTGDDFEHLGLYVAPDLDTVMYNLAGLANPITGWGRDGETLELSRRARSSSAARPGFASAIATSRCTSSGRGASPAARRLSEVTAALCGRLGILPLIAPMSDQPVRTMVATARGELAFQHYFVRDRCEPAVAGISLRRRRAARGPARRSRPRSPIPALGSIVVCPSNPFVSVDPILAVPGVEDAVRAAAAPVIAVSPIVAGAALKGPAAKMMRELRVPVTAVEVARHYARRGLLDGFVLDRQDEALRGEVEALGVAVLVTDTVMMSLEDRERLAREVLDWRVRSPATRRAQVPGAHDRDRGAGVRVDLIEEPLSRRRDALGRLERTHVREVVVGLDAGARELLRDAFGPRRRRRRRRLAAGDHDRAGDPVQMVPDRVRAHLVHARLVLGIHLDADGAAVEAMEAVLEIGEQRLAGPAGERRLRGEVLDRVGERGEVAAALARALDPHRAFTRRWARGLGRRHDRLEPVDRA